MDDSDGITKKIKSQIAALENLFDRCHYVIFSNNEVITNEKKYKNIDYDLVYVRNCNGKGTLKILYLLCKLKMKKVTYEIPTYPYWGEIKTTRSKLEYGFKKVLLRFFVNNIVYVGHYDKNKIWGVPANEITNAISGPKKPWELNYNSSNGVYNIVGVASQAIWHGYDRLIRAIAVNKSVNLTFHVVGDGPALDELKELTKTLGITNKVHFHGRLEGNELYELLSKMDCGIDSLGRHRVNVTHNSSLKAKEYLAFGLPVVMSHIDESIINNKFVFKVESSEEIIDIELLVNFFSAFVSKKEEIQKYAYDQFSWESQFIKVIN